jgi:hypothetical protein
MAGTIALRGFKMEGTIIQEAFTMIVLASIIVQLNNFPMICYATEKFSRS